MTRWPLTALERFEQKVDKSGDCWEWTAEVASHGYGKFYYEGRSQLAHRVSYILHVGPIPAGLQLDHLCRNRSCVNPAHLEPVTNRENSLRGNSPAAQHAKKVKCVNGHPFSGENLLLTRQRTGVRRVCLACRRERDRQYKRRVRAAAHAAA